MFFPRVFVLICCLLSSATFAIASGPIRVTKNEITAQLREFSLSQALMVLTHRLPLEVKGSVDESQKITVDFSGLTLSEALTKMMTGYNYVLIYAPGGTEYTLFILGKASPYHAQPATQETPPAGPSLISGAPTQAPGTTDKDLPTISQPDGSASPGPIPSVTPAPVDVSSSGTQTQPSIPSDRNTQPGPDGQSVSTPNQTGDANVPFNPAAWGGRGYRGPGRK